MIVVADTSPLNYLILLGHVEVLPHIYEEVIIPHAVSIEMQHPHAPPEVQSWIMLPPVWLRQVSVEHLDGTLTTELGDGERQAISLALQLRANALLIDEFLGRQEAAARLIPIAGTLTILFQASLRGLLEFPEELERLRKIGFRFSRQLETFMMARHNAEKGNKRDR